MSADTNIVVTGSAGFVGRHLMKKLPGAVGLDLKNGFNVVVNRLPQADVIIHLAAKPMVPYSVQHPYETYVNNVMGTLKVLEACRTYKAKIVFASSAQAGPNARNPYALQKYHCEQLIKQYGRLYGVEYSIHRIYNIFGPGEHGVIGAFLEAKKNEERLQIVGGQQRRDFIHVDTVVEKLIESMDYTSSYCEDLGSGTSWSVQDIADMISPFQTKSSIGTDQPMSLLSPKKTPTKSVSEYIKEQSA
jgi:nucleoside-diphosphate-sugar epimerase